MTEITASFQKSRVKTSLKHNQRTSKDEGLLENKGKHIDWSKTDENLHLRDCESLRKTFNETFKDSVDAYNKHQKRKDRRISDYYSKALSNSRLTPTQEFVVQLGDRNTIFKEDPKENRETWGKLYQTYLDSFENRNPNLRVASATVHFDEQGGPHMHIVTIPVGTYSRGMKKRANFDRAMGWNEKKKDFDNFRDFQKWKKDRFADWADNEREQLLECAREMGYDVSRKKQAKKHEHMEPQAYRELQEELQNKRNEIAIETARIDTLNADKDKAKKELLSTQSKYDESRQSYRQMSIQLAQLHNAVATAEKTKSDLSDTIENLRKQKSTLSNSINSAYENRKNLYLETSELWGNYREKFRQLKEEEWKRDPAKAIEFAGHCEKARELRETLWILRPTKDDDFLTATWRFITEVRLHKHEKRIQEMKQEEKARREKIEQAKKALLAETKRQAEERKRIADEEKRFAEEKKAERASLNEQLKETRKDRQDVIKIENKARFLLSESKKNLTPKQAKQLSKQVEKLSLNLETFAPKEKQL